MIDSIENCVFVLILHAIISQIDRISVGFQIMQESHGVNLTAGLSSDMI